eukprot:TRINITY_DN65711_c9_g1_i1.p1 TRINITY_DN65711_c9_g1~~TRINITY_DN65711_c9_g1_i1.p1  ORF type:complete len:412 (-),score=43.87 TRINITY_DN65711_c9_g1_i1:65-1300(-)
MPAGSDDGMAAAALDIKEIERRRLRRQQEADAADREGLLQVKKALSWVGNHIGKVAAAPIVAINDRRHRKERMFQAHTREAPDLGTHSSVRHKGGKIEVRVGQRYQLFAKVGEGAFGAIFRGVDTETDEDVAIKLERRDSERPQLLYEARLYKMLNSSSGHTEGVPQVHWYGREGDYTALVMDYLGDSLEKLFAFCGRQFSLKTTLMIADKMLFRLEYIHNKYFVHRDIKPDNILLGHPNGPHKKEIFLIDFGLAKRYKNPKTNRHRDINSNRPMVGTARYVSINTHNGLEQSRRDDLESLGYTLLYFLRGSLPWQGIKANTKKEKYDKMREVKLDTSIEDLCGGFPEEFAKYMSYVRGLRYEENPDYGYMRKLFREVFLRYNFSMDYQWDWDIVEYELALAAQQDSESEG